MMRGRISLIFFVLLVGAIPVILGLSFVREPRKIDNTIPYIYYYENTHDALIVERADGSDSRVLMDNMFNADGEATSLGNPAWSPSGKWLAWRGNTVSYEGGYRAGIAGLVSTDGKIRRSLNDIVQSRDIRGIAWSPVEDVILVNAVNYQMYERVSLFIIEADSGHIIAQTDMSADDDWMSYVETGWFKDGSGIYYEQPLIQYHLLGTMTTGGRVSTWLSWDDFSQILQFSDGRLLRPVIPNSTTGDATLAMEDLGSGRRVLVGQAEKVDHNTPFFYQVNWNDDLSRALIQECDDKSCEVSRLYVMDWQQETLFAVGTGKPIFSSDDEKYDNYHPVWSPDGRYLVYADARSYLTVMDAATRTTQVLKHLDSSARWYWKSTTTAFISTGADKPIYRYDAAIGSLTQVIEHAAEDDHEILLSPDERYLFEIVNHRPAEMFDLQTGLSSGWIEPSAANGRASGYVDALLWSFDSRWLISGTDLFYAGGGVAPDKWMIHNLDGSVRRELGLCYSCAGFVPERALPYLAKGSPVSVIPQPLMTLQHDEAVYGVAWSPDGTHIASSSSDSRTTSHLNIWDMTRAVPTLLKRLPVEAICSTYTVPCRLTWSDDGQQVTVEGNDTREIWDIAKGIQLESLPNPPADAAAELPAVTAKIYRSGWSRDGKTPFMKDYDGKLYLMQAGHLRTLDIDDSIDYADYRAGSPVILAGNFYARIYLWDAATGERLRDINWFAQDAAISPDGTRIAAAGTQLVTIWNIADFLPSAHSHS